MTLGRRAAGRRVSVIPRPSVVVFHYYAKTGDVREHGGEPISYQVVKNGRRPGARPTCSGTLATPRTQVGASDCVGRGWCRTWSGLITCYETYETMNARSSKPRPPSPEPSSATPASALHVNRSISRWTRSPQQVSHGTRVYTDKLSGTLGERESLEWHRPHDAQRLGSTAAHRVRRRGGGESGPPATPAEREASPANDPAQRLSLPDGPHPQFRRPRRRLRPVAPQTIPPLSGLSL
jgi:hypothetical protein